MSGAVGLGEPCRQPPDVLDAELAVAVGERDQLVPRGTEAGAQRAAVPEVGRVVDGADDARVPRRQLVGEGACPVARAVVDGDDLERLRDAPAGAPCASSTRPSMFASSLWAGKK